MFGLETGSLPRADAQKNHRARQQFMQQQYENEVVLKELGLLQDDANVYKLIGPVLVKQDPVEARSNVEKRLDFIGGELKRLDSQLGGLQDKQGRAQQQVMKLQQELQRTKQGGSAS
ncbi:hypothetical protein N2152v2_011053 [Parachlorella kessleri]